MLKGQHIGESPIIAPSSKLVEEAKQKEWGGKLNILF